MFNQGVTMNAAIYYYRKDDNIDDAGLSFRREREEDEVDDEDMDGGYPGEEEEFEYENHVEVGHASTKEGRIIVFCNNLQVLETLSSCDAHVHTA